MWHKCNLEILYKPKGIFTSKDSFYEALSKFFTQEGYRMDKVKTEDEYEGVFTIEPVDEKIEEVKVVKIPTKKY